MAEKLVILSGNETPDARKSLISETQQDEQFVCDHEMSTTMQTSELLRKITLGHQQAKVRKGRFVS